MNARITGLIAICMATLASAARAAENIDNSRFYVIGDVGPNFMQRLRFERILGVNTGGSPSASANAGVRATVGVGYNIQPGLAAEAELGFSYNELNADNGIVGGVPQSTFMRLWHVPLTVGVTWRPYIPPPPPPGETEIQYGQRFFRNFRPYIGGGIGVAEIFGEFENSTPTTNPPNGDGHDTVLTYYLKAGLSYPITDKVDLGVQYRFYGSPGFTIKQTQADEIYAHAVSVALRIRF